MMNVLRKFITVDHDPDLPSLLAPLPGLSSSLRGCVYSVQNPFGPSLRGLTETHRTYSVDKKTLDEIVGILLLRTLMFLQGGLDMIRFGCF